MLENPPPRFDMPDPDQLEPGVLDPPAGYLVLADMIEQVLRRNEAALLARQGLSDSATLRAAVARALSRPHRQTEPEILVLYDHDRSVLARSGEKQRRYLAEGWLAAWSLVWQSLIDNSLLSFVVTSSGGIFPVPPRELEEANGPDRVLRRGIVTWHDVIAPNSTRSGNLVVAREDFGKWLEAGLAGGTPTGNAQCPGGEPASKPQKSRKTHIRRDEMDGPVSLWVEKNPNGPVKREVFIKCFQAFTKCDRNSAREAYKTLPEIYRLRRGKPAQQNRQ
jgi:hypothetical protein